MRNAISTNTASRFRLHLHNHFWNRMAEIPSSESKTKTISASKPDHGKTDQIAVIVFMNPCPNRFGTMPGF